MAVTDALVAGGEVDPARMAITKIGRDMLDRVISTTDAENKSETYTLNAFGDRTKVVNKLTGVIDNTYDRRGLLLTETLPEVQNAAGQTIRIVNTYTYDSRGNRTKMEEASNLAEKRTTTYTYDKLDRLLTETGDAVDGEGAGGVAGEGDGAVAGAEEGGDGADGGGLAHAVAAHEGDDLAFGDVEVDAEEGLGGAVEGGDALEVEEGGHAAS